MAKLLSLVQGCCSSAPSPGGPVALVTLPGCRAGGGGTGPAGAGSHRVPSPPSWGHSLAGGGAGERGAWRGRRHQHWVTPPRPCPPRPWCSPPEQDPSPGSRVGARGPPGGGCRARGVQGRWGPLRRPQLNKLVVCGGCSFSGGTKKLFPGQLAALGSGHLLIPPAGCPSVHPSVRLPAGHPWVPRGGWGGCPGDGDSPVPPRQASAWRG